MANDEDTFEEIIIHASFEIPLNLDNSTPFKLLGLETDKPIVQIGNEVFQGEYDNALGTLLYFEKTEKPKGLIESLNAKCQYKYDYVTKTDKMINFKSIHLKEKESETSNEEESALFSNLNIPNSQEDALKELETLLNNPF